MAKVHDHAMRGERERVVRRGVGVSRDDMERKIWNAKSGIREG